MMKEVNALFFKRTLNLRKVREEESYSSDESSSVIRTDSSMEGYDSNQQRSWRAESPPVQEKKLRGSWLAEDRQNARYVKTDQEADAAKPNISSGCFVGSSQFRSDLFDNQFISDEKSKMVFSSVEQTLKKNMAEQTQKQLQQLQVERASRNIKTQGDKYLKDVFHKHKVKSEIHDKLAEKFAVTGKKKNVEKQLEHKIAEKFKKERPRRRNQKMSKRRSDYQMTAKNNEESDQKAEINESAQSRFKRASTIKAQDPPVGERNGEE